MGDAVVGWRSTYREVYFAAFGHLFGENSEEVENGCMALHLASKGCNNGGQNVLPRPQLYCQYGQADAELYPNRFGSGGELLEKQ